MTDGEKVVKVDLFEERYWEVFDDQEAKIIAHFFDSDLAQQFVSWLNEKRGSAQ